MGNAFEVHGDIRAKYNALGGAAGPLGLPTTDETPTPDGIGAFNHFQGGSIYWTGHTGPFMVRGAVRDRWAASGWERGPLGYPVQDQHRMALLGPSPLIEWCRFENGLIAGDARGGRPSPFMLLTPAEAGGRVPQPALLSYVQVGDLFANRMNQLFKASPGNVALRPGVELTGVSGWEYGFWASKSRSVGFKLRGFHDNGLATDTDFTVEMKLRLELTWASQSFTEPTQKTLIAILEYLNVGQDGGLPIAPIYASVDTGIIEAFYGPEPHDPAHPEVPSGAIFVANVPTLVNATSGDIAVLDVVVTSAGDLQVLVNPLTLPTDAPSSISAALRQLFVQNTLNALS